MLRTLSRLVGREKSGATNAGVDGSQHQETQQQIEPPPLPTPTHKPSLTVDLTHTLRKLRSPERLAAENELRKKQLGSLRFFLSNAFFRPIGRGIVRADTKLIHPRSPFYIFWMLFLGLLLFPISIITPLRLAFEGGDCSQDLSSFDVFDLCVDSFFVVDLVLNFFVGMHEDGVKDSFKVVAAHYVRSGLLSDTIMSFPVSWVQLALSDCSGLAVIRITRILRLLRVLRLVRLLHLGRVVRTLRLHRAAIIIHPGVVRIIKVFGVMLLTMHLSACLWWFVKRDDPFVDEWMIDNRVDSSASKYLISLYFAVSTLTTVGYGDVHGSNDQERGVALLILIVGAIVFSSLVSSVSSVVSSLAHTDDEHEARKDLVLRFLKSRKIATGLRRRISDFLDHFKENDKINEKKVLSMLPLSLREELTAVMAHETLASVPLFDEVKANVLISIYCGLKAICCAPGEVIVAEGEDGTEMFFIISGSVVVCVDEGRKLLWELQQGAVFGEIGLLLGEKRTATVVAKDYLELLVLSKDVLDVVGRRHPTLITHLQEKAKRIQKQRSSLAEKAIEANGGNMVPLPQNVFERLGLPRSESSVKIPTPKVAGRLEVTAEETSEPNGFRMSRPTTPLSKANNNDTLFDGIGGSISCLRGGKEIEMASIASAGDANQLSLVAQDGSDFIDASSVSNYYSSSSSSNHGSDSDKSKRSRRKVDHPMIVAVAHVVVDDSGDDVSGAGVQSGRKGKTAAFQRNESHDDALSSVSSVNHGSSLRASRDRSSAIVSDGDIKFSLDEDGVSIDRKQSKNSYSSATPTSTLQRQRSAEDVRFPTVASFLSPKTRSEHLLFNDADGDDEKGSKRRRRRKSISAKERRDDEDDNLLAVLARRGVSGISQNAIFRRGVQPLNEDIDDNDDFDPTADSVPITPSSAISRKNSLQQLLVQPEIPNGVLRVNPTPNERSSLDSISGDDARSARHSSQIPPVDELGTNKQSLFQRRKLRPAVVSSSSSSSMLSKNEDSKDSVVCHPRTLRRMMMLSHTDLEPTLETEENDSLEKNSSSRKTISHATDEQRTASTGSGKTARIGKVDDDEGGNAVGDRRRDVMLDISGKEALNHRSINHQSLSISEGLAKLDAILLKAQKLSQIARKEEDATNSSLHAMMMTMAKALKMEMKPSEASTATATSTSTSGASTSDSIGRRALQDIEDILSDARKIVCAMTPIDESVLNVPLVVEEDAPLMSLS